MPWGHKVLYLADLGGTNKYAVVMMVLILPTLKCNWS